MHVKYSASALIAFGILVGTGCNEAIYTLGRLPAESEKRNSCREIGASSANGDVPCSLTPADGGVRVTHDGAVSSSPPYARQVSPLDSASDGRAPTPTPGDACIVDRRPAVRKGLNLYLLVDDSLSVVLQPAWNSLTLALSAFVDDPKNTGVGLGVGYYGTSCNSADYAAPAVRVVPLPDSAQAIKASYPLPISGKALTPAVNGALAYARTLVRTEPDRDTALVLLTDGIVDPLCGSTEMNATQAIAAGVADPAAVRTYVIALGAGPTLLDPANIIDLSPLDRLAAAGGTEHATRIEVNLTTNTALTTALDATVTAATPCAYQIPSDFDAARASLEWEPAGGTVIAWPRVASASACAGRPGTFVRSEAPGYLELCPASCAVIRGAVTGAVRVRTACK